MSPYLYQHRDNLIWWQEWSSAVLDHARANDRILFVSVGYATCHWCHVMAAEAFSDPEIATYLNKWFVCIKVDREQRPDIDHVMMQFLVATMGQGGWPLNAFLSPNLEPFFAMTYAPPHARPGMPGFLEILQKVRRFYGENRGSLKPFVFRETRPRPAEFSDPGQLGALIKQIDERFDRTSGGFRGAPKFPPHSSLLFLLYQPEPLPKSVQLGIEQTIDAMIAGGLHDHLQGGFYRYCVDVSWTIPHFEKMLYDQAMMLWNLSLAYRRIGKERYREAAEATVRCLEDTFRAGDLFVSAHDADTDHEEGSTYVWDYSELTNALSIEEFKLLSRRYELTKSGNFEGKIHLNRRNERPYEGEQSTSTEDLDRTAETKLTERERRTIAEAERKLLTIRHKRAQPEVDRKHVTSWNCLTAIALLHAERYGLIRDGVARARAVLDAILVHHWTDGTLAHSSIDGRLQRQEFLEDYAALALLASFLDEERQLNEVKKLKDLKVLAVVKGKTTGNTLRPGTQSGDGGHTSVGHTLERAVEHLGRFERDGGWIDADNADFMAVPADTFDHPTPTGRSLALWAKTRAALLQHRVPPLPQLYGAAMQEDAYNCAAMLTHGEFHQLEGPELVPWSQVPTNTVQLRSYRRQYCYRGACKAGRPEFAS